MATLAADSPRTFEIGHDDMIDHLDCIASDIVYDGALVGESASTGSYRPLASGDKAAGFCIEQCDNSSGAISVKKIKVRKRGVVKLSVTGVSAIAQVGSTVFATDDDTFTLTPSGTKIGVVSRWITSTTCMVAYDHTVPDTERYVLTAGLSLHASKVTYNLLVAPWSLRVLSINWVSDIAQAVTGTVVKATSTTIPASATTPMHTADAIVINTTAHTVLPITLTSTVADLALVAGQRIGFVLNSAMTTGSGTVVIEYERIRV